MLSYWEQTTFTPFFDFIIVGGGLTGLSAARELKHREPAARVLVLERGLWPAGASVKNAGFACFGSPTELLDDLARRSEVEVFDLVEQRLRGLHALRQMLGDEAIGYRETGAYELFCRADCSFYEDDEKAWQDSLAQLNFLNAALRQIHAHATTFEPVENPPANWSLPKAAHLINIKGEGQIHTGRMMHSLLQYVQEAGVLFYGGVDVKAWEERETEVVLHTAGGMQFRSAQVLFAVNGFAGAILNLPDLSPARNQVVVAEVDSGLPWKGNFHYQRGYFYFRPLDSHRVLVGGGRHLFPETEATDAEELTDEVQQMLEEFLREVVLPKSSTYRITHRWSGILGVGEAKQPVVCRIGKRTGVALRLGGMGVAIGCATGKRAAELLLCT